MASASRIFVGFALLLSGPAAGETLGCTPVPPLPAQITVPGHYCLASDVAQDFGENNALRIAADDVVLDCNGHRIRHAAPGSTGGHGITVGDDRDNVTVRNCVVDGFHTGISVIQSFGVNNATTRLQDNTVLRARVHGIFAFGSNLLIENNRIDQMTGNAQANAPTAMYLSDGRGNVIRGNSITDIRPIASASPGLTIGLYMQDVRDSVIEDNHFAHLTGYTGQGVYGIIAGSSSGLALNRNTILSPPAPGTPPHDGGNFYAILLQGTPEGVATNVCRDNVTGHYNANIAGCTEALNAEF